MTGPGDGPGIPNADFVLYVSTLEVSPCISGSRIIAFAGACEMEQILNR